MFNFALAFDANTGTLMSDTTGQFSGNAFDYTGEVNYRFAGVPWLAFYSKLALNSSFTFESKNYKNDYPDSGKDPNVYPEFRLNGMQDSFKFGFNYFEAGLRFFEFGYVAVRQNLSVKAEATVPVHVFDYVTVTPYGGIHAFPFRFGPWWSKFGGTTVSGAVENPERGKTTVASLKDVYGGLSITVPFKWTGVPVLNDFSVGADFSWHTNGENLATRQGGSIYLSDSKDALLYNGYLRVNFTVNYRATERLAAYLQVRYEEKNPIPLPQGTFSRKDRVSHDVYLRGGVSYRFGAKR